MEVDAAATVSSAVEDGLEESDRSDSFLSVPPFL